MTGVRRLSSGTFQARIGKGGETLGTFATEAEAQAAYEASARACYPYRFGLFPAGRVCGGSCGKWKTASEFSSTMRRDRPGHSRLSSYCKPCLNRYLALRKVLA